MSGGFTYKTKWIGDNLSYTITDPNGKTVTIERVMEDISKSQIVHDITIGHSLNLSQMDDITQNIYNNSTKYSIYGNANDANINNNQMLIDIFNESKSDESYFSVWHNVNPHKNSASEIELVFKVQADDGFDVNSLIGHENILLDPLFRNHADEFRNSDVEEGGFHNSSSSGYLL